MSCVALAFGTRARALAAWTVRLGGKHWLLARLLIGWLFMHDLEESCDVRASNIEFARAVAGAHACAYPPQTACGWCADYSVGD